MVRIISRRLTISFVVALAGFALALTSACGDGASSPTSPSTTSGGSSGLGITTYTYTNDVRPILISDCVSCHGPSRQESGYNFTTYQGVLRAVMAGSDQSPLVRATGPRGVMYPQFSGNRAQKSQILYDWVVNSHAAE